MKKIVLYGAGGHASAAVALIRSCSEYQITGIYDDQPRRDTILEIPVFHSNKLQQDDPTMAITVGNNVHRKAIAQKFESFEFPSFIHASVVHYASATIGIGTQILPLSVLDAEATLGNFCIVNNQATVSHNVNVGDFSHIAINAAIAGGVSIGEGTLVGAGSVILPEIKVGKWVTIGAGAVVTKDVPDYSVVYGNPARIIKK